jgi:Na+/H+ antiporter NhaD/arsenite permease-like protein
MFFLFFGVSDNLKYFLNYSFFEKNVFLSGIFLSQVLSNVPAAILLSEFTFNYKSLILSVNIGGFGTLIASLANLISYRMISKNEKKEYLIKFSFLNFLFLILFSVFFYFLGSR